MDGKYVLCLGRDLPRLCKVFPKGFDSMTGEIQIKGISNDGDIVYAVWVPVDFKADYVW